MLTYPQVQWESPPLNFTIKIPTLNWWHYHENNFSKMSFKSLRGQWFNSLAPGKFEWNFRHVIFKQILVIDGRGIACEITLMWMSLNFTDDQSTLVQVMVWCRQATSYYLSPCWPRSLSPYDVSRPQWINSLRPSDAIRRQGTESTLAQVMACCLTAPSHYLNQCWLIISKVLWHSSEGIIVIRSEDTNQ